MGHNFGITHWVVRFVLAGFKAFRDNLINVQVGFGWNKPSWVTQKIWTVMQVVFKGKHNLIDVLKLKFNTIVEHFLGSGALGQMLAGVAKFNADVVKDFF